ncbi:MAG: 3-isopropylmalate dehydrogenase, partial [Gammaproteobacteria bacterium]|nr:3-isopropylmalate dehydrogenase [Gammaproteobacteria bacterium]
MSRIKKIVGLPGDGIGPEVYNEAKRVLLQLKEIYQLDIDLQEYPVGGAAIDSHSDPLPQSTIDACAQADAILLGAIGGPKWDQLKGADRPEAGLLKLRKTFNLFANLRPVSLQKSLASLSPLKTEKLQGVDMLIVRELTGGLYFGNKFREGDTATDTCVYSVPEIERITRLAFKLAQGRRNKVTSVDKANVMETSRLWRETVIRIAAEEFPEVELEHILVDAAAMHLIAKPAHFDVLLTENLFGDILSDEASMLCGSLGVLPSASFSGQDATQSVALYEPIHGSAPDIAGQDIANPAAMLLSLAMLLRHSLGHEKAATDLEKA